MKSTASSTRSSPRTSRSSRWSSCWGGRRPAASEERAGTFDGKVARGRWGAVKGELAAADIAAAMAVLGDLLQDAHCAAGGGVTARDP
eukprot:4040700-Pleurochrysis_carterae.AAC.1